MQKKYRLGGRRTFSFIYARGSRASGRYMTVITCPSARRGLRIGVVAGKKVGKSVVRNKVRRRMKEIVRRFIPYMENGYNYILVASAQASGADFAELITDMSAALTKAGKLSDKENAERAARGE